MSSVGPFDNEGEDYHSSSRRRADNFVSPVRLVVREDPTDGLIPAPIASKRIERLHHGLLDDSHSYCVRQVESDMFRLRGNIAFREPQAEDVRRAKGTNADSRGDSRVHPARDGNYRTPPTEASDSVGGSRRYPVQAGCDVKLHSGRRLDYMVSRAAHRSSFLLPTGRAPVPLARAERQHETSASRRPVEVP